MDLEDIDAVVAITRDELHAPIAIDLLRSGKHVFIEKPIATNAEDARQMVHAAERAGKKLMVAYMKRYDDGCVRAKEIIDNFRTSNELGKITFVRVHSFGGEWVCNLDEPMITADESYPEVKPRPPRWMPNGEMNRFNSFNNVYCHDINLLRWFVGDPREVKYSTFRDDYHNSVLDYEDFNVSFETGHISSRFWDEEIKVYFEHGWVEIYPPPPLLRNVPADVKVYKAGSIQRIEIPYSSWTWSFKNEAQHFIECIKEDKNPRSDGKDSLKDMIIMQEIYRSFLGGKAHKFRF
jgi:predicted dehydrogenase